MHQHHDDWLGEEIEKIKNMRAQALFDTVLPIFDVLLQSSSQRDSSGWCLPIRHCRRLLWGGFWDFGGSLSSVASRDFSVVLFYSRLFLLSVERILHLDDGTAKNVPDELCCYFYFHIRWGGATGFIPLRSRRVWWCRRKLWFLLPQHVRRHWFEIYFFIMFCLVFFFCLLGASTRLLPVASCSAISQNSGSSFYHGSDVRLIHRHRSAHAQRENIYRATCKNLRYCAISVLLFYLFDLLSDCNQD